MADFDPTIPLPGTDPKLFARFMNKVNVTETCWTFTGHGPGYRSLWVAQGKFTHAHRFAWLAFRGTIPGGLFVCHRCDVPACVRPDHLFLGTHADNMHDKVAKGRQPKGDTHPARLHPERMPRGERNGWAKLTDAAVREIRALSAQGMSGVEISHRFNIGGNAVSRILSGKTWRHVK